MARSFSVAITNKWGETFKVDGMDSFDEALKAVEKGLYAREITKREFTTAPEPIQVFTDVRPGSVQEAESDLVAEPVMEPDSAEEVLDKDLHGTDGRSKN